MEDQKPTNATNDEKLDAKDFSEENIEDTHQEEGNSNENSETSSSETEDSEKPTDDLEKEKERKRNSHFAELRRQREAKEKAEKEERERLAREDAIREEATLKAKLGMVKTNPYTNEKIVDAEDLRIYEIQKELDDDGLDPISDLPKKLAEINRKKNAELIAKEKERKVAQSKIDTEIQELRDRYPDVDTGDLARDKLFQECLVGRAGRWTQVEIYEYYLNKKNEIQQKEVAKKEKSKEQKFVEETAEKMSKTPSSTSISRNNTKSVSNMNREEYEAYWRSKYGS